ncbi:NAD-glutamate dehydrogenase [Mariniluteicoccus flavus]
MQPTKDRDVRGKESKIAEVADLGAERAQEIMGADPDQVRTFVGHYFRHVDAADVVDRDTRDLLGLVNSHVTLAGTRADASPNVRVFRPVRDADGWEVGAAVVQVVTNDLPFLVDTVSMEVLRQGWNIREVFHPQYVVRRDAVGGLEAIVHSAAAFTDPMTTRESWIHLEVDAPLSDEPFEDVARELEEGLRRVIGSVEEAVEDWQRMRAKMSETVRLLEAMRYEIPCPESERDTAEEFLTWLGENHFTFLGYREYRLTGEGENRAYAPVPTTGLGILRADADEKDAFHALPPTDDRPLLMVVTKDNVKSTVHRPSYLDYVGVRLFDGDGHVVGERRFLGLFAASAYTDSVKRIPMLRAKADRILRNSGYDPDSHGAKAIEAVVESYPRDELFQTKADVLSPVIEQISRLRERRQVRVFARRDTYGRFASFLVYFPRDRYNTAVRQKVERVLMDRLGGASVEFQARANESILARLHFVVRMAPGQRVGDIDLVTLETDVTAAVRSWDDDFAAQVADGGIGGHLAAVAQALPEGYKEDFSARHAVMDLSALTGLGDQRAMDMVLYTPDEEADEADLRFKVFRRGASMSLSQVLPHLTRLGVDVIDERPYEMNVPGVGRAYVYDFGLKVPGGEAALASWTPEARQRFGEAFEAAYAGQAESDLLHGLVLSAGLDWREVTWLRTISRYLQQAGTTHSQAYIAQALLANVEIAADLAALFRTKFDPAGFTDDDERHAEVARLVDQVTAALDDVASLDHDRIIRSFLAIIGATIRTNAFRDDAQAMAIKLLPRELKDLPEPRPAYEIFVCSPRLEGVHLRFGDVARGGLRWSDRREDFRTEVLGLVKAQMVKNTVIVPVGAKGGFFPKQLPDPGVDRNAWFEEGRASYKVFINSLLDVTDNIVEGEIDPPRNVVRYDGDDPYLVVAADKGTATFSDTANEISTTRGFWMGDAFASGGSVGYDHKAMGITARGAWESVKRHFREMGVDCQTEDFTCVGIGDMAGDVFGNGMLLSKHIRLVAAFNHQHIFLDPTPDAASSWEERRRLFDLPRSSWSDYDASLISEGGGIHSRQAKSIPITPQVREALGIDDDVTALPPTELISAILTSPVDLLWNGGIGTYVKAATETHTEVGDKANDVLRVNGEDLRCKAIGEGGNLGCTQLGRIEYAMAGGRVNTDFIDNSAGVDTSDHEVNIKILLQNEVAAGRLTMEERNVLLGSMTDEVAELVLAHNYDQNLALANGVFQAASMAGVHERWMAELERIGLLDRGIEFMPSTEEMGRRMADGRGLTAPELSTLLAYTKIHLEQQILASDLPDDPYLADRLVQYFPAALREKYAAVMPEHRLHREIITTVAVNRYVNSSGITGFHRMVDETTASAPDIIRAQLAARSIFKVGLHEVQTQRLDNELDADVQTRVRLELRNLVERGGRWILMNRPTPLDVQGALDQFTEGVQEVKANLASVLSGRPLELFERRHSELAEAGVPDDLARVVAGTPLLYQALGMVQNAQALDRDVLTVARIHFALADELGLDRLLSQISALPRQDHWDSMARAALRDDLLQVHAQITAEVLRSHGSAAVDADDVDEVVTGWVAAAPRGQAARDTIASVIEGRADVARLSVGLRTVRSLLP